MPSHESIVVVEDWISEHYFTADGKGTTFQKAVEALRKEWDREVKDGRETVLSRFSSRRSDLQAALAGLTSEDAEDPEERRSRAREAYRMLRSVLEHTGEPTELTFERGGTDLTITGLKLGGADEVLWLETTPNGAPEAGLTDVQLLGTNTLDGAPQTDQPVSKLLSDLYRADPEPRYVLVASGQHLYLTERGRWFEGRYLRLDVQLILERQETKKYGEVDRFLAIAGRQSLVPDADGAIWWDQRLDEAQQHAVGVSQDLRDGIRESIEIIANDVLERRRAQGLAAEDVAGQDLARQSLRFLYRILFLLYAEAAPELGVLPKGAGEYDAGYGLDRLRELTLTELTGQQAQQGTHLYESLYLLFQLVNGDHPTQRRGQFDGEAGSFGADAAGSTDGVEDPGEAEAEDSAEETDSGLQFEPLEADLFDGESTPLIDQVKLSNRELQRVLERLLLSRKGGKGERGFISYANLGINQLGAVYEGLMSYTGFIAEQDLLEVAKNGDAQKGSWVVPVEQSEEIDAKHFVRRRDEETGIDEPVVHPRGSFVFRLAGRERQQSASYYTPEVLTRFVVSQALEELLDDETPADRILELAVCEPALGSGAFAIEAVRQLAEEYLTRKQAELGTEIPSEEYAQELQRVKAQIALHQVHGVDLNETAVELAEVSLWLDTMQPKLHAPWFGLRLKRGNSLIGARRATYSKKQVEAKAYLSEEPQPHPLTGLAEALGEDRRDPAVSGRIHHFLLPGEGWGAAAGAKEVKDLAAEEQKALKTWARSTRTKLSKAQIDRLLGLSARVETLWSIALRRLQVAESQARRFIDYWPHERAEESTTVTRAEIERALNDPAGAYQRLKRVMNAWNALWFWPLTEQGTQPPSIDEWLNALEGLLGLQGRESRTAGQRTFLGGTDWYELNAYEELDLGLASASSPERLAERHPWLAVCDRIAEEQGFFHWELEFAPVFARGGFDLQVGNPPWVRPRSDESALLAEHDPWWQLTDKPTQTQVRAKREETLATQDAKSAFVHGSVQMPVLASCIGSQTRYGILQGLQPDLYRAFMVRTWANVSSAGVVSLLHPGTHFTEKRAASLRAATYRRIRRHWAFRNKRKLFAELTDQIEFGVHVYGVPRDTPAFTMAASLYVPQTVEASYRHDGSGPAPALKTDGGDWDTAAHAQRLIRVDLDVLKTWARILDEPGTSPWHARMVYPVNRESMTVLEKLSDAPRVRELGLQYSRGWDESIDRKKGYFDVGQRTNSTWDDVILQGPHFSVANPFSKVPREDLKSNNDWDDIDLEALPVDFLPPTNYQPNRSGDVDYDGDYGFWELPDGAKTPERNHFRIAWRRMASTTSVRTLYPTVIPPGSTHVDNVFTALVGGGSLWKSLAIVSCMSSLVVDFLPRMSGASKISGSSVENYPASIEHPAIFHSVRRIARLICLTRDFAPLWGAVMTTPWSSDVPVRLSVDRRQAQIEIDALVALSLGISADELCTIYRTQFPVLRSYEQNDLYDANGRKAPQEMNKLYRKVGESGMSAADLQWTHPQSGVEYTFEFPFRSFDREEDMRVAYEKFARMLEEHGEIIEEEV